ncbi:MAG: hypothetical protein ACTSW4_01010 [Candidatus Ranarchaeia archaeon]
MEEPRSLVFQIEKDEVIDAPPNAVFTFLTRLDMRPWIDHGIGWRVSSVRKLNDKRRGVGSVYRWLLESDKVVDFTFKVTEWIDNEKLTLEDTDSGIVILHQLTPLDDKTKLTITKKYYSEAFNKAVEAERLATLLDNIRVVMRRKRK